VGTFYLLSWRARRRGQHARGVALGLTGGMLGWLTGYLGGHLSFGRGVGVGDRGVDDPLDVDPVWAAANDAVTMAYDGAGTS
ncbi:MAG: hypothetical protein JWL70_2288, partial [Acidimicrobiia bacterium]|nr:hypothetical protein [Acidimicrobiia bacterium]